MIPMYDIGVIGDYDSICGFSAVGFKIFPVESVQQAKKELKRLADSGYGVIYMTEFYMENLQPDCEKYDEHTVPCIIPIPAFSGVTGFGESRLKRCVEKAVGSDIVYKE